MYALWNSFFTWAAGKINLNNFHTEGVSGKSMERQQERDIFTAYRVYISMGIKTPIDLFS